MKKPRKAKPKKRQARVAAPEAVRPHPPLSVFPAFSLRTVSPARSQGGPTVRRAATYSADDRDTIALLIVPFFLVAFVMTMSQTLRGTPSLPDLASDQPVEQTLKERIAAYVPFQIRPETLPPSSEIPAKSTGKVLEASRPTHSIGASDPAGVAMARPVQTALAPPIPELPARDAPLDALEEKVPTHAALLVPPSGSTSGANVCVAESSNAMAAQAVALASITPATNDPIAFGRALAAAARSQLDDFVIYTDAYRRLAYPMGDVPPIYGVCTDVIIRAYRAVGLDLQALVHEARVGSGDTSIDHRRVDTLRRFFTTYGESLPITEFAEDYRPGDVVTYYRPQNRHSRSHIAIVSDVVAPSGRHMIIHNRGWGPQQEDGLFVDKITGHYRYTGAKRPPGRAPQATRPPSRSRAGLDPRSATKTVVRTSFEQNASGAKSPAAP